MSEETTVKRNTPRDLFLHLLAVVTLYWSAISFVAILWQFINKAFPDVLDYYGGFNEPMRFAISSLIIVFPVFILVSWYLNKLYSREAVVRESKIRKWLIYLTLFITALVIIVDLVTVINTFLNTGLKARFVLKALSVLVVAAVVFWYYLDDVRRETPTKLAKYFAWATGIMVLLAVIGAFFVVGSPATARLMQFDQQKTSDLDGIQSAIINYWQAKEKIPATLSDLNDSISGYTAPNDPQTGAPYEYVVINSVLLKFKLCADFNKEAKMTGDVYSKPCPVGVYCASFRNWDHAAGKVCFERTIDRQFYRPLTK